jgi:perosamine synthetase
MKGALEPVTYGVLEAIAAAIGPGPAALHEPRFEGNELEYLKDCLDSSFVSSVGPYVDRLETDLATFTGAPFAVAVVNGTAALQVALSVAGVQPGDEVLVPAMSFVATANAVVHVGAIPHFVDCEERTLGLDPRALGDYLSATTESRQGHSVNRRTGRVIRAVVPMHAFGHPMDIEKLLYVAAEHQLVVVEDAAESLGSSLEGRHTGTFGLLGILSFNGNKTITTGGGGAILTADRDLARAAKHLTTTAKLPHRWEYKHDRVAYNYRMPNLNAALGCAQLEQLPALLDRKRQLYERYRRAFQHVRGATVFPEPERCSSNYWLQTLVLDPEYADRRDEVLEASNDAGYGTRPVWEPLHRLRPYIDSPRMRTPITDSLARRLINLPSSPHLVEARGR